MEWRQLDEIVATLMKYDTPDSEAHRLDIAFVADGVRGTLIEQWVKANGETSLELFATDFYLPVQQDKLRGLPYVDMQAQILGLQNYAGIIDIGMPQEYGQSFTLIKGGMNSVYSHLEAGGDAHGKLGYTLGTRIYFKYLDLFQDKIRVTAIPAMFAITDRSQQVPQPLEMNDLLIQTLRARFAETKRTATDNVPQGREVIEGLKTTPVNT